MSWQVADRVTVYHEAGMYALAPTVTRTPGGDLLVSFQRAPHLGYDHHEHPLFQVLACRSRDDGLTWSEAALLTADPRGGVMDRGLHALPDGSLFLHASCNELVPAEGEGVHGQRWISRPGKPFWVRSRDDGRTWTAPRRFPPLPDGRLLLPSKATDRPGGAYPCFGMLRVSRDLGESWEYGGRIAEDDAAHFSEPAIHRTPSGHILVLFRCHPGALGPGILRDQGFDGPVARDPQFAHRLLALVESDDDGATWTPWRPTRIHGSPAHLLGLRDGRIFLTVGTRWEGQRGCAGRVLDPRARTWRGRRSSSSRRTGSARTAATPGRWSGRTVPSSSSTGTTTPTATAASRPPSSRRAESRRGSGSGLHCRAGRILRRTGSIPRLA